MVGASDVEHGRRWEISSSRNQVLMGSMQFDAKSPCTKSSNTICLLKMCLFVYSPLGLQRGRGENLQVHDLLGLVGLLVGLLGPLASNGLCL